MPVIKMNLSKDEIEMLLHCIDSAVGVVDLSKDQIARVEKLRNELSKGLK